MTVKPREQRVPVVVTCRRCDHAFPTAAKPGSNAKCPACKREGVNASAWVSARDKEAGAEGRPPDGSPAEPEPPPLAPVDLVRDADPEHPEYPCATCHQPMRWSSGRTRLLCSCSGKVTFRLPSAVGQHHEKLKQKEVTKRERSAVAAQPNLDETRMKVELAGQATKCIAWIDSLYRWAEWLTDSKYDSDLAFLGETRSRLDVICDRARATVKLSDFEGLMQLAREEAVRVASRWGNQAFPGPGWEGLGYLHPSSVQHVRPSSPKRVQLAGVSDAKRSALAAAGLPAVIDGKVASGDDDYEDDESVDDYAARRTAETWQTIAQQCRKIYEDALNDRKRAAAIAQGRNRTRPDV